MKKSIILLAAALIPAACNKPEITLPTADHYTLYAQIEQEADTKTYMDESNNIRWSKGDQIVGFMKSSLGLQFEISSSSVGKTSAHFDQVGGNDGGLNAGTEWDHNIVYYPYSAAVEAEKSGSNYSLSIVLPAEQTYAEESFGEGAMAMVAVSEDNNITFRNALGGMKLQLRGTQTVTSITLEGKNNEKLSGAATVTAYTDETKPAITMASDASTSVALNCGSGVQLNESTATEFIISLPPVLFSQGFTVTVIDSDGKTYTVETDKANTVLRSSLLTMPAFKLGNNPSEEQPGDDDELIIPVSYVNLNYTSLKLYEGDIAQLTATVGPKDATDKTVVWSSDNPAVATVDQTGLVTALAAGTAKIIAAAGGKSGTCSVTVSALAVATADYIDEYGVNHGKGTAVGMAIWAPVNCGYHATDFKYGKLYQWGRKYGQGYSGNLYDVNIKETGTYSDASVPTIEEGGVSVITGNHKSKENIFYTGTSSYDWVDPLDDKLWNSGTESKPVKTEYDPCPDGWRVPTYAELDELAKNSSSWTTEDGQVGYWFSGARSYTDEVPQVFFPAAGYRNSDGIAGNRGYIGTYWSSRPFNYFSGGNAYRLDFKFGFADMYYYERAYGYSVRCVQE